MGVIGAFRGFENCYSAQTILFPLKFESNKNYSGDLDYNFCKQKYLRTASIVAASISIE